MDRARSFSDRIDESIIRTRPRLGLSRLHSRTTGASAPFSRRLQPFLTFGLYNPYGVIHGLDEEAGNVVREIAIGFT